MLEVKLSSLFIVRFSEKIEREIVADSRGLDGRVSDELLSSEALCSYRIALLSLVKSLISLTDRFIVTIVKSLVAKCVEECRFSELVRNATIN